jgi:nucleoside-diphosphate-sugar epimerase
MTNTALVTGGTGFIGGKLVQTLLADGNRVRILVRHGITRHPSREIDHLRQVGVEVIWGSVLDRAAVEEAATGVDLIFHLAGRLHRPGVTQDEYVQLHVEGTRILLEACLGKPDLRSFVHCSSTGVLGPTGPFPLSEDAPYKPSNYYESSKAAGECLALDFANRHGVPVTIARPALAYGPGDLHLMNWFRSIHKGFYRLVGSGENLLHPIYVDDVVSGLLSCASKPASVGKIYHLVGGQTVSVKQMATSIARALSTRIPQPSLPVSFAMGLAVLIESSAGLFPREHLPLTRSRVKFMTESRVYLGQRARAELDFIPQVNLEEGLRLTVEWYRQEGLL